MNKKKKKLGAVGRGWGWVSREKGLGILSVPSKIKVGGNFGSHHLSVLKHEVKTLK